MFFTVLDFSCLIVFYIRTLISSPEDPMELVAKIATIVRLPFEFGRFFSCDHGIPWYQYTKTLPFWAVPTLTY